MTCGIYLITNKINGMQYIGQSVNIEKRFKQHCYGNTSYSAIDNAIKEFGRDCFDFDIICTCSEDELNIEEKKLINLYGSFNQGYNLTSGGKSNGKISQTVKEKISKAHTVSGFLNVHKVTCTSTFQGFSWKYNSMTGGENIIIQNADLNKLKEMVLSKGLVWKIINKPKALKSLKENEYYVKNLKKTTNTGFLGVSKVKHNRVNQGFIYQYNIPYNPKGISSSFGSISLKKLKNKVISKGLPWGIVDEEKARETIKMME